MRTTNIELNGMIESLEEHDGEWAAFKDCMVVMDRESGVMYICEIKSRNPIQEGTQ